METPKANTVSNTTSSKQWKRYLNPKFIFWLGILLLLILFLHVILQHFKKKPPAPALPSVVVNAVRTDNVPVYIAALGSVIPSYSVIVRTQINGQLLRVLFKEGQMVKKGDLLAEIDPRPYQAQLLQYQGQLARDLALLQNAKLDVQRYQTLWKQDSVAKQILDTQISLVSQDEGIIKIDQGLIESTNVNLAYTKIVAPINGRVGLRLVDPGNYVQVSDVNGIAVINTLNPIDVVFTIPEDNVPEVLQEINAGKILTVLAYDRLQQTLLANGKLLTIDNQIDPTTGTVKLKAKFQNDNLMLFPNQFVNVKLLIKTLTNAMVIPTAAIQYGSAGTFVYKLNKNNTVTLIPIKTGVVKGNETSITGKILVNELVVVEGADKLTDGALVTISKRLQYTLYMKRVFKTHWSIII